MNPAYEPYELIDRYLLKSMSKEERILFEQQLATDENLREMLEAQKVANELLIDQELVALKSRMQKDMHGNGNIGSTLNKVIIGSVALLLTGVASYSVFNAFKSTTPVEQKEISVINETRVKQNESTPKTTRTVLPIVNNTTQKDNKVTESIVAPMATNVTTSTISEVNTPVQQSVQENATVTKTDSKNIVQENTKINPEPATIDCNKITIEADAKVNYGLNNDESTIVINKNSIRGGTAPYQFSIDNQNFASTTEFENLKDGTYHLYVRDKHNCISSIKKSIVVKRPVQEINESFSPTYGSKWNFPLKNNLDGKITIFNKNGSTVYSTNIVGGYPNDWDGRDNDGKELDSGNYVFIINFADNETIKGHITIFK